jgi:aspartyl-tRNA(Asn)/glutamyl-tRNA(Gln) amidotransferase subunit A
VTDLTKLSLAAARKGLKAKDFSAAELTEAYLSAIERANPRLNAYVAVTGEAARAAARASDEKLAKGQGGPLEGVPLGIKDLFAT